MTVCFINIQRKEELLGNNNAVLNMNKNNLEQVQKYSYQLQRKASRFKTKFCSGT